MRKTFALLVLGLLAIAAPALAEAQLSGSFSLKASSDIDQSNFENPEEDYTLSVSPSLSLSVTASEGDAWSVTASILSDDKVLNAGKVVVTTPSFTLSGVQDSGGTYVLSKVADPFDFVVINNPDDMKEKGAVRLKTSALGPSLTLQFDENTQLGLASSAAVGPATVGVVSTTALPKSLTGKAATKLAGYATAGLGLATVTGGFGTDLSQSEDNFGFGVKAVVKPVETVEANASYVVKQAKFGKGDRTIIGAGAKATFAPIGANVSYSLATRISTKDKISDRLSLSASYKLAPVEATVGFSTGNDEGADQTNPKTAITGSVSFALIPDVATLKGDFAVESDKDRELSAFKSGDGWQFLSAGHTKFGASVEYKLSEALTVTSPLAYHSWSDIQYRKEEGEWNTPADESISMLELGLSATYKVSDAVSLTASVKNQAYTFSDGLLSSSGGPVPSANRTVRSASLGVSVRF